MRVVREMRNKVHPAKGGLTFATGVAPNFLLAKVACVEVNEITSPVDRIDARRLASRDSNESSNKFNVSES